MYSTFSKMNYSCIPTEYCCKCCKWKHYNDDAEKHALPVTSVYRHQDIVFTIYIPTLIYCGDIRRLIDQFLALCGYPSNVLVRLRRPSSVRSPDFI